MVKATRLKETRQGVKVERNKRKTYYYLREIYYIIFSTPRCQTDTDNDTSLTQGYSRSP